jgi:hypothetical protein
MKLEYKNYKIISDRNCFILSIYWNKINNKTKEVTYRIIDEIYPSTLSRCFIKILEYEKAKIWKVNIEDLISTLDDINKKFLEDLSILLADKEIWIK